MKIEYYPHEITEDLMDLLLTADPDRQAVTSYLTDATILVTTYQNTIIGVAVLVNSDNEFELKNIAVHLNYQGRGVAKNLIAALKETARIKGASKLYVGTGNSSLSQLALYQKCGFRLEYIERDFFLNYPEAIFENGIRCLDKIVLAAKL